MDQLEKDYPAVPFVYMTRCLAGTATRGMDYTGLAGTMNIPAGATSKLIVVTPVDDSATEANETVSLKLSGSCNYNVWSLATATLTILDNH